MNWNSTKRTILSGHLANKGDEDGAEVVVISGDKDLTQLATDNTTVLITRKGITDIEKYTPDTCNRKVRHYTSPNY